MAGLSAVARSRSSNFPHAWGRITSRSYSPIMNFTGPLPAKTLKWLIQKSASTSSSCRSLYAARRTLADCRSCTTSCGVPSIRSRYFCMNSRRAALTCSSEGLLPSSAFFSWISLRAWGGAS